jgi:opacity protein-like surface antigen
MNLRAAVGFLVAMVPATLQAGHLEATLQLGQAFPFYEQGFSYDPGPVSPPFPGVRIEQRGTFNLNAKSGLALGGAVAYLFHEHAGLELRLDTADVRVTTEGARFRVRADLPAPLPDLDTDVDLGQGTVDLERLRPISLGAVVRAGGTHQRVFLSAGGSFLPAFRFEARQAVGVAAPRIFTERGTLDLARVTLGAEALPSEEGQGRFGLHVGGGLQLDAGKRAAVTLEGRYFHFQPQTLTWDTPQGSSALPLLEQTLVRGIGDALEPVTFNPRFFHVTVGLTLRF